MQIIRRTIADARAAVPLAVMLTCILGGLLASVNAASADMCNSDQRDAAQNQNCDLDTGVAWTAASSPSGLLNTGARTPSDVIVSYLLSGATFDNFNGYPGGATETLSGTWTVDYTTMTITALSLTATGTETINFTASGASIGSTGGGDKTQYQLIATSTETGSLGILDYQTSPGLSLIASSFDGNSTHLHLLNNSYFSGLNSPGQLTAVPEPGSLALFGVALLALGGLSLRRTFG